MDDGSAFYHAVVVVHVVLSLPYGFSRRGLCILLQFIFRKAIGKSIHAAGRTRVSFANGISLSPPPPLRVCLHLTQNWAPLCRGRSKCRASSTASNDISYVSEPDVGDGGGTWTVVCSHCHQQTDASQGFHTRMKSTAANTLYNTGVGMGVGGGGATLRRAKRKGKHPVVGHASDLAPSADLGSASVLASGGSVKHGGNARTTKGIRSAALGRRPGAGLYGGDVYRGGDDSAPLGGDNFSSQEVSFSSSPSVGARFESDRSNLDESGRGDGKACGDPEEGPSRVPPVGRAAIAGIAGAGGRGAVGVPRGGRVRAAGKNDGGLIRLDRVVTPEGFGTTSAGLRAGPGGSGAPGTGGGWQGSWRRSSESMLSSASLHSELDAASFSRSLQAQAAALRAALCSSNASSNIASEAEPPATAAARGLGSGNARRGSGGGRGGTDASGGQGLAAAGASALPPRPSSLQLGARSITSPAALPLRDSGDQGGQSSSGAGAGASATTAEGGRPPMQPSALPPPLPFDRSADESSTSDNDDGGEGEGAPQAAPRQKSLLLPWIMPGSRRPASHKVSSWIPGSGRAAAAAANDDINLNESIGMSSAASVSSVGSTDSMRLGAEAMTSPTVSPTVSASAASASSDGRRRATGAIDPNRTWTPVASSRSGGSSLPPRQFSFNLSEFSSDNSDVERSPMIGIGGQGGGNGGGGSAAVTFVSTVSSAGSSTPRATNAGAIFGSAAAMSGSNSSRGGYGSPTPPCRPFRNAGVETRTPNVSAAETALFPCLTSTGGVSTTSTGVRDGGNGGNGDMSLAPGIDGRAIPSHLAFTREDNDGRCVAAEGREGVGIEKGVGGSETEELPLSSGSADHSGGDWARWLVSSTGSARSYVSSMASSNVSAEGCEDGGLTH